MVLVIITIIAGLVAASQMGKVPGALPLITTDLGLDLTEAGLVVSVFSILAAVLGLITGIASARIGRIRSIVLGLGTAGICSIAGSYADGFWFLITCRIGEGLGFVLVAVSAPGLIASVCPKRHLPIAMGVWGAFIPAAMTAMLLITPIVITSGGWQLIWMLTGGVSLIWLLVFGFSFRGLSGKPQSVAGFPETASVFSTTPLLVVGVFICYSALFGSVTAFLPTYWTSDGGLSLETAAYFGAFAVFGNVVGNIAAGFLTGKGVSLPRLFSIGLGISGICAAILFVSDLGADAKLGAAMAFTFFAGFVPGGVFSNLPSLVRQPAEIPLLTGLIFQGAGIGQVCGPLLIGLVVETSGSWSAAALVTSGLVVTALFLTLLLSQRQVR